ncbi:bile acid:sodium symporter family protein [Paenibacillus sp. GD4]|uniref:bile acid:sodium symporter family protein n=1 Tax=Paenibacillus sp. GD4 TaxID=3068890 RepID=UPI00279651A3|nr:bile acid:sodium symporter family protein [Paenibacillus sp. GD4]MDQ1909941.1 bile acid:sodium symporter family protein [Paenibacillus sp. GD4]
MLQTINKTMEKWMPLVTPTSVVLGILFSTWFSPYTAWVPWIFGFMTFSGSLSMNFGDLKRVLTHPFPILVFLTVIHILMPLLAWGIGHVVYPGDPLTITGLILLLCIPTGIVSFMWVSIYKGHIALTLSMILIDTMLAPFLVPSTLSLLVGAKVEMDVWGMMEGLTWMIVVPSLLGMALNQWTRGEVKKTWGPRLSPFSKVGLAVVVMINSSVIAGYFTELTGKVIFLAFICVLIVAMGYLIGWGVAKLLGWDRGVAVSMMFNCGMRNISAGAVMAISYFPPPVALPVIIGMVFQQMMASSFAYLFFRRNSPESGVPTSGGVPGRSQSA